MFLGGGHVNVKLEMPLDELIRTTNATVANISDLRKPAFKQRNHWPRQDSNHGSLGKQLERKNYLWELCLFYSLSEN